MTTKAELTVFDVGHGDHLLLRIDHQETAFHAVIDCNWHDETRPPPAVEILEARGVRKLDLLVLTHPHHDHFMGLAQVARHFTSEGRRLDRYADFGLDLRTLAMKQYGPGRARRELLALWNNTLGLRRAGSGPRCSVVADMIPPVSVLGDATLAGISPLRERFEDAHAALLRGEKIHPNQLSTVLVLRLAAAGLLLAADLENPDWEEVITRAEQADIEVRVDVVKVGHHGATNANPIALWDAATHQPSLAKAPPPAAGQPSRQALAASTDPGVTLAEIAEAATATGATTTVTEAMESVGSAASVALVPTKRRTHAAISTRGSGRHPAEVTLHLLIDKGVDVACTNYGPVCASHVESPQAQALRWLGAVRPEDAPQGILGQAIKSLQGQRLTRKPCFGTTSFLLDDTGVTRVTPTVRNARCHLRDARVPFA